MNEDTATRDERPETFRAKFRDWSVIISAFSVPVVVAVLTIWGQVRVTEATLQKDYVQMSLNILTKPKSDPIDPGLREWAADMLDKNASVKLKAETRRRLSSGEISLPSSVPVPTVSLSANPTTVSSGGTATLTWSSTNADSCTASGGWTGLKAPSGVESVGPLTGNTTFTLTCTGSGGSAAIGGKSSTPIQILTSPPVRPLPAPLR